MTGMANVLLIDDDEHLGPPLAQYFERIGLGDQAQGMGAIEAHAPEQREQLIVRLGLTCQQGRPAGTGQVHQGPPGRQCVRVCAHGAGALGRLNHHAASRGASA